MNEIIQKMKKKTIGKTRCIAAAAVLVFLFSLLLPFCEILAAEPEYREFSDLEGKTVAMLTGAPFEELIKSKAPKVGKFQYFQNMPDMMLALKDNKIDAYLTNSALAALNVNQDKSLAEFPQSIGESSFGFAMKKGDKRRDKWQKAYEKISERTKNRLWEKWTGADESKKTMIEQDWPGRNGTVKAAVCDTLVPMSYRGDSGEIIGFDVEMILLMAKELDVHVDFIGMEFASIMPSIQAGKAEIGAGSLIVTDERKEMVDFIEYYPAAYVLIVRSLQTGGGGGFFAGLKDSFDRTFIRESRYKMVLSGLMLTVLISVLSAGIGIAIAFILVFMRHADRKPVNYLLGVYSNLVAGVPAVVILMVLYYIVFGAVKLPAAAVAVVGFSLIFAARAYNTIWNAVGAVDGGQTEAALALGYSEKKAFREIVLPQSRPIFVPVLNSQFINLVKETSIAGFITVVELTRAGDLIRARTMEAFFPLISVAVIYFVLTWLLSKAFAAAERSVARDRQSRIIKGVD